MVGRTDISAWPEMMLAVKEGRWQGCPEVCVCVGGGGGGGHLKRVLLGSSIPTHGTSSLGCLMLDSRHAASCELTSAGICIPDTRLQQNKASC